MSDPLLNQIGGGPIGSRSLGTKVLEVVCAALLAIMVILLFIQVFGRYALNDPPEWTEELGRTVFAYCTFMGAALAIQRNAHLRIDALVKMMPATLQTWVRVLMSLCAIVFLVAVLWYSSIMLPRLAFQPMTALPFMSKAWFFAAVPVGCFLMLVYEVHILWVEGRRIIGAESRS